MGFPSFLKSEARLVISQRNSFQNKPGTGNLNIAEYMPEVIIVGIIEPKEPKLEEFRVSVDGWSKRRTVRSRGNQLFLEVAMADCMCNTCVNRFLSLVRSMDKRNVSFQAGSWSGDVTLCFEKPKGFKNSQIEPFLTERIGLRVSGIEKIQTKQREQ